MNKDNDFCDGLRIDNIPREALPEILAEARRLFGPHVRPVKITPYPSPEEPASPPTRVLETEG